MTSNGKTIDDRQGMPEVLEVEVAAPADGIGVEETAGLDEAIAVEPVVGAGVTLFTFVSGVPFTTLMALSSVAPNIW